MKISNRTFIIFAFFLTANIPMGTAQTDQVPTASKEPDQLSAPAMKSEQARTRTLELKTPEPITDSIDFLMETPIPTQDTAPVLSVPSRPALTPQPKSSESASATLQSLKSTKLAEKDDVAMLVIEQCSQSGDANTCERVYSNHHKTLVITQNANEGDEQKEQTVMEESDEDGNILYRKTVRHRVDYNYLNDRKAREKEFFDIILQPRGKPATRELMVYEYFLDSGKVKSLSWTRYGQIADEPRAELVYNILLRYGGDGSPERGLGEQWDHGNRTETFLDWKRDADGFAALNEDMWGQLESWVKSLSVQACVL